MNYAFKPDSQQAYEMAQRLLLAKGFTWQTGGCQVTDPPCQIPGLVLNLNLDRRDLSWCLTLGSHTEITTQQLTDFALNDIPLPATTMCKLGDYDAVLIYDEDDNPALKLGCQIVTLEQARAAWELLSGEKAIPSIWAEDTWIARDRYADAWYVYKHKPRKDIDKWAADPNSGGQCYRAPESLMNLPKCDNWEESLTQLG